MKKTDFTHTPIYKTLQDYLSKDPIRMHIPFHTGISNNNVFPKELYNIDISEVSGYDIEGKDNPIFQSEKITADFFGVRHSFYLTGGASSGLLASMIALRKFGKKVILARNVHKSVINGVVLADLEPVWLEVDFLSEWGIFSKIESNKLEDLLRKHSDIAGCVIVSPTYEGIISDVKLISDICHEKNILLIVDEAHGAHLYFLGGKTQFSALQLGGDLVIQSWHKTLGSLTQSGVLHLCNERFFTYYNLRRSLDLISSTSPSFLLLLSLELTRKYLAETKGETFHKILKTLMPFRNELKIINNISLFESDDSFKIYLKSNNLSGIDFAYELYKNHSIEVESANEIGFLMLIGSNFNEEIASKIMNALKNLQTYNLKLKIDNRQSTIVNHQRSVSLREAFFKGFTNKKDLEYECNINAPCPPGYAINIPGMKK